MPGTNQIYVRDFVSLNAVTATGGGTVLDCQSLNIEMTAYIVWASGSAAGQVKIETADTSDYTGTWAPLATITYQNDGTDVVQVLGTLKYVRARVSSAVTSGTVTVKFSAN